MEAGVPLTNGLNLSPAIPSTTRPLGAQRFLEVANQGSMLVLGRTRLHTILRVKILKKVCNEFFQIGSKQIKTGLVNWSKKIKSKTHFEAITTLPSVYPPLVF